MRRKRGTLPPASILPTIYSVRADGRIEADKNERDAWSIFLRWCHQLPEGTKVEMLRDGKVCAWLTAGTRERVAVKSPHAAPPTILA